MRVGESTPKKYRLEVLLGPAPRGGLGYQGRPQARVTGPPRTLILGLAWGKMGALNPNRDFRVGSLTTSFWFVYHVGVMQKQSTSFPGLDRFRVQFTLDSDECPTPDLEFMKSRGSQYRVSEFSFGWLIQDEFAITVQYTTRQDSTSGYLVSLAAPDDKIYVQQGEAPTDDLLVEINRALDQVLTEYWS